MASKLTDQVVDKRLIERNIRKGLIDRKGVDQHIAATKDVEANAEHVPLHDPETPEDETTEGATTEGATEATAEAPAETSEA